MRSAVRRIIGAADEYQDDEQRDHSESHDDPGLGQARSAWRPCDWRIWLSAMNPKMIPRIGPTHTIQPTALRISDAIAMPFVLWYGYAA
jgi:hypothetical protein